MWKAQKYNFPDSGEYLIDRENWVTVSPELLQGMKNRNEKDKTLSLQQLLGLPITAKNKIFIEFWVKPGDLFRPCPDKEISDKKCNLCFTRQDSLDMNHIKWINDSRISNYFACGLNNKYPWTALGYTYDWMPQNKTHKGLSEFVIRKNSKIYITRILGTEDYLKENLF